jgi:hypothetical protein
MECARVATIKREGRTMSNYYTLTAETDSGKAAEWTYRTALDPVISAPRSRVLAVALYKHAKEHGYVDIFRREWLSRREDYMRDMILRQRSWQQHTRKPSKARNHDSISIRERYVRAAA